MNLDVMSALNELEKERGIAKEIILEAIDYVCIQAQLWDIAKRAGGCRR